jgi:transcriptional regulator with XRE-family HTH domain
MTTSTLIRSFGSHLKKLRENRSWTQDELAEACGFGSNQIAQFENAGRVPGLANLIMMADGFQISLDELVGRKTAGIAGSNHLLSHSSSPELPPKPDPSSPPVPL